jgi:hypothetical protein
MTVIAKRAGVVVLTEAGYDVLQLKARGAEDYAKALYRVALFFVQVENECDGGGLPCGPDCECAEKLEVMIGEINAEVPKEAG